MGGGCGLIPVKREHSRMCAQRVGHCERKAAVKRCLVVRGLLSLAKGLFTGITLRRTCPGPRLLPVPGCPLNSPSWGNKGGMVSAESSCPQEAPGESRADVAERQARLAPAGGTC